MAQEKYKVENPRILKSWEPFAKQEILRFINDEKYHESVVTETMPNENMGPFTKFLYHFAGLCAAPWGVLIDFDERKQRVYLPDHYYKWMHKLRDELFSQI